MTSPPTPPHRRLRQLLLLFAAATALPAGAADPQRGAQIFASQPAPGQLGCVDCHSETPQVNNFGNIFVGRNASALILRAVLTNTGGMGYFRNYYDERDFADIAAWLGNTPADLDFGTQPVASRGAPRSVTISASSKAGLAALRLSVEGEFAIVANGCAAELPARESCTVDLAFAPQREGDQAGTLVVAHDGLPTPARIALRGRAILRPPALVRVEPASLAFAAPGAARTFRLANVSPDPLTLGPVAIAGGSFEVAGGSCAAGLVLAGGQSCALALRFPGPAPASAVLTVQHDGVGGGSTVALVGAAGAMRAPLTAEPAAVDFGSQPEPGLRSARQVVWLQQRGPAPARLAAIGVAGEGYAVDGGSCAVGTVLAPGARCSLGLRHQGAERGLAGGELRVAVDGAALPLRVPLAAQVAAPGPGGEARGGFPALPLVLQAAPGTAVTRRLWFANAGAVPLRLGATTIGGDGASELLAAGSCSAGRDLPAGAACEIELTYAPRPGGARAAQLRLAHDGAAAGSTTALQLHPAPAPWLDQAVVDLGVGAVGAAAAGEPQTVRIGHRGPGTLVLDRLQLVGDGAPDFTAGGNCRAGLELPSGAACELALRFLPRAVGARSATLVIGAVGAEQVLLALGGIGVATLPAPPSPSTPVAASALRVDNGGTQPTHAEAAVGDATAAAIVWTNHGPQPLRVRGWSIGGAAAGDFSVDDDRAVGVCRAGTDLAPGAACELRLRFHPLAAGWRQASITLWAGDDPGVAALLTGRGVAPAVAQSAAAPGALVFDAATPGAAGSRQLTITNAGSGLLELLPGALSGEGYSAVDSGPEACATAAATWLLPGQSCTLEWSWAGAAAFGGARWATVTPEVPLAVRLSVHESALPRRNAGAGALHGPLGAASLLLLLLAVWALAGTGRGDSPESPP